MSTSDFLNATDPFDLLAIWYPEAAIAEPRDADAAQLATVDESGMPNVRTVLVREQGAEGFVFYTNFQSIKGQELLASRKAALLYYWKSLARQVRIRGEIIRVDDATADAYFASRPRQSQIGAHASRQSEPMADHEEFENRIKATEVRFAHAPVSRPPYWSGFRLVPISMEFWQERPFRLHERLAFRLDGNVWRTRRLYP